MLSPRLIHKSVFYTQSVVRSLQSAVRSAYFILTVLIDTNHVCSVGMRDDVVLLPKLGQLFCLQTRLRIALALGWQLQGHFHFRNNETEDMLVYQSNPLGVELIS